MLGMGVPSDVHLQFHLCYGDASHTHSIEPATSHLLVDFTNRLRTEVRRTIELVHMPVPRGRTDEAYYEPLSDLDLLPETKIALGLVHYTEASMEHAGASRLQRNTRLNLLSRPSAASVDGIRRRSSRCCGSTPKWQACGTDLVASLSTHSRA
jgi:hypothetical protein